MAFPPFTQGSSPYYRYMYPFPLKWNFLLHPMYQCLVICALFHNGLMGCLSKCALAHPSVKGSLSAFGLSTLHSRVTSLCVPLFPLHSSVASFYILCTNSSGYVPYSIIDSRIASLNVPLSTLQSRLPFCIWPFHLSLKSCLTICALFPASLNILYNNACGYMPFSTIDSRDGSLNVPLSTLALYKWPFHLSLMGCLTLRALFHPSLKWSFILHPVYCCLWIHALFQNWPSKCALVYPSIKGCFSICISSTFHPMVVLLYVCFFALYSSEASLYILINHASGYGPCSTIQ